MRHLTTRLSILFAITAAHPAMAEGIEMAFVDHIEAGMIEQDVFVARHAEDNTVFRVTTEDYQQYFENTVYTTAEMTPHDPMNVDAVGPHPIGFDLGISLGDWLAASGTASYQCSDETGEISVVFTGLVPNGLYTLWTFYMPVPFTEPFSTYDIPIGARDGKDSVFRAGPEGSAVFELAFEPCLQGSSSQLVSGLAAAYHSDGKTYGHEPGTMGDKTHVHLFAVLPSDPEMPR
ncbi:hypothetical protein [Ruegeria atlantica]|uniref:hypothetical protein n=1 Tax=Ruegeria atlantica TaxID=81569 RepID=UPI001481CAA9|nr:hypothetical protein [Ruegeria atlantica]